MRKRLLTLLVCLAMLCSLLPAAAAAADQRFSDMPAESHWSYKALAAAGREPRGAEELLPVYLRLSQAERERQARMKEDT